MADEAEPGRETEAPGLRSLHASMIEAGAAIGAIGKNLRNEESGYSARSIDDILDAVHRPLNDAGIVLIPTVRQRVAEARESKRGGAIYYVALEVAFHFHGEDGRELVAVAWGEAMDSSDKAGNKAMSAALKMALIQTFTIPVTGEDADALTPETAAPRGTVLPPAAYNALSDRMSAYFDRVGRRVYPDGWKADDTLRPLPYYRDNGITQDEYDRIGAVMDAAEAALPGPEETKVPGALPDKCPECGTENLDEHVDGCSWEPF